jgi:hypothetical protein
MTAHVSRVALNTQVVAIPNGTLRTHCESPHTQLLLRTHPWDAVVLQEHSIRCLHEPEAHSYDVAQIVEALKQNTTSRQVSVILQANWARAPWHRCYVEDPILRGTNADKLCDALLQRTREVALKHHVRVSPVGRAWQLALAHTQAARMYYRGGNHANLAGALLTAHVHAATISGASTDARRWRHENAVDIAERLAHWAQVAVDEQRALELAQP